jgi:hypothetical protein
VHCSALPGCEFGVAAALRADPVRPGNAGRSRLSPGLPGGQKKGAANRCPIRQRFPAPFLEKIDGLSRAVRISFSEDKPPASPIGGGGRQGAGSPRSTAFMPWTFGTEPKHLEKGRDYVSRLCRSAGPVKPFRELRPGPRQPAAASEHWPDPARALGKAEASPESPAAFNCRVLRRREPPRHSHTTPHCGLVLAILPPKRPRRAV